MIGRWKKEYVIGQFVPERLIQSCTGSLVLLFRRAFRMASQNGKYDSDMFEMISPPPNSGLDQMMAHMLVPASKMEYQTLEPQDLLQFTPVARAGPQ